jgi:hypothetical protein
MDAKTDESAGECPVAHTTVAPKTNRDWWPNQLNIQVLHHGQAGREDFRFQSSNQNSNLSNPMGAAFDYAKEFKSLDLKALIKDLHVGSSADRGAGRRPSVFSRKDLTPSDRRRDWGNQSRRADVQRSHTDGQLNHLIQTHRSDPRKKSRGAAAALE